jgi:lipopolysaccharide/colanic/teichoic acid biosynthesis glycosyltransferase
MSSTADRIFASPVAGLTDVRGAPRFRVLARHGSVAAGRTDYLRRGLNVAVAGLLLVLLSPVMLLIALVIRLTSPGPVFYTQTRVGLDRRTAGGGNWRRQVDHGGRLFTMYKFRTMTVAQSIAAPQVWATPDDPRITPVGRVLRKFRLDELPQLVNVLKGDMNVVGPRPEQPAIFASLRDEVEHYALRQRVLPGITGWAQIHQSYDSCVDDVRSKVRFDLYYLRTASAAQDLKILARTVPVVLLRKGAW